MLKNIKIKGTDLQVNPLCLGTMYMGTTIDEQTSNGILDLFYENEGQILDTANKYASWIEGFHGGESETLLGRWMTDRGNRDQLLIATKVGLTMEGVDAGLKKDQIIGQCEASLKRLQTDVIDIYFSHIDDRDTSFEETLAAFDSLIKDGKVRHIAASNINAWRIQQSFAVSDTHGFARYCAVQQKYSYLQPRPGVPHKFALQQSATDELLDFCRVNDFPLFAYSPVLGGCYQRDDRPIPHSFDCPDNLKRLNVVREIANELDITPNQVVLSWMVSNQEINIIPLISGSNTSQVKENIEGINIQLSPENMDRMDKAV